MKLCVFPLLLLNGPRQLNHFLILLSIKIQILCGTLEGFIRKKGFGPGETQVALGNFYSPKEYLALWAAQVSLGVFENHQSSWAALSVSGCLWTVFQRCPETPQRNSRDTQRHLSSPECQIFSGRIEAALSVSQCLWMSLDVSRVSFKDAQRHPETPRDTQSSPECQRFCSSQCYI